MIIAAWPREVSRQIAGDVRNVLTTARGGVLTVGAIFAIYFASSGVESLRIGLNRAYGLVDPRPWWLLRLESIGYVLVAAVGLLALSFLVVLGPLVFRTALSYAPWLAAWKTTTTSAASPLRPFCCHVAPDPAYVAAGRPPAVRRRVAGHRRDAGDVALCGFVFGRYLSDFSYTYVTYYAGLASAMIALVFLYFTALIFIYGGELNAAIARAAQRGGGVTALLRSWESGQAAVSATAPPVSVLTLRA